MDGVADGFNSNDVTVHPQVAMVFQQTEHVNKISIVRCRRQIRRKTYMGTSSLFNCRKEREKLFAAVGNHDVEAVDALLKGGVSVNCCDEKFRTPLHVATASADEHIVKLLLKHGADTGKRDIIGSTCLHLAACNCNIPIVTLLLQHGADVRTLDSAGKNPMQLASGKLKFLRENKYSSDRLKHEISSVISLMQEYLRLETPGIMDTLDELNKRLKKASLEDEIAAVGELLSDLTNLHINNRPSS